MKETDPVKAIENEFCSSAPSRVGSLQTVSFNSMLEREKNNPEPRILFPDILVENNVHCLFSDPGLGKSILAVQIGEEVARKYKINVLYINAEMSPKQVQLRYTSDTGHAHQFPSNFFYVDFSPDLDEEPDEQQLLADIEQTAVAYEAGLIIVDNLTYILNNSEKGEVASRFMKELKRINREHNWTILIIAHTPKRAHDSILTRNDLAGSSRLSNFFDIVIGLGKASSCNTLYIKQIKVRSIPLTLSERNVQMCTIVKQEDALYMVFDGHTSERKLVRPIIPDEHDVYVEQAAELVSNGMSLREAERETGIPRSTISRKIKEKEKEKENETEPKLL